MSSPPQATVTTSGNETTITFPESNFENRTLNLSSNSSRKQIVTAKEDDKGAKEYQITGEKTKNEAVSLSPTAKKLVLTFSYEEGGKQKASELQQGGPYNIGRVQAVIIAAENGDDSDFNDAVAQVLLQ
jgi:preprotein translocase subunit SecD